MNNLGTYEKIVKASLTGKRLAVRIAAILLYAIIAVAFLIAALINFNIFAVIALVGALVTVGLIKLTWKYLQLEYEYSFSYGTLSVAKIYGKRTRRQVAEADIKSLIMIVPATKENIARAEHLEAEGRVIAVSSESADNIWLVLTGDKNEKRVIIFFEADERSLAILKSTNPYAFSKSI